MILAISTLLITAAAYNSLKPVGNWNIPRVDLIAAEPFMPNNAKVCSPEINRGAQETLNNYMSGLILKEKEKDSEIYKEIMIYKDAGASTAGADAKRELNKISGQSRLERSANDKIYEFKMFAAKKYKCLLNIFYVVPPL
jgi:hypothetical protein